MRRSDRAQSLEFAQALIDRCTFGVVAISTGEDTPYCLPLSLVRVDNRLYFHCAKQGRKLNLLRRNPKVCVTFVGTSEPAYVEAKNTFTDYFQSAMVTGTASEVLEDGEKIEALRALCARMTPEGMSGDNFERAVAGSLAVTGVWRIDMEEVTAKAKLHK